MQRQRDTAHAARFQCCQQGRSEVQAGGGSRDRTVGLGEHRLVVGFVLGQRTVRSGDIRRQRQGSRRLQRRGEAGSLEIKA